MTGNNVRGWKGIPLVLLIFASVFHSAWGYPLKVVNHTNQQLTSCPVEISLKNLPGAYRSKNLRVETRDGETLISQVDDLDRDQSPDELVFLMDLEAGVARTVELKNRAAPGFVTDLSVPDNFSVFKNQYLEARAFVTDTLGLKVKDRSSGKHYLDRLYLSENIVDFERQNKRTRVLAKGPVRVVVDQRFETDDNDPIWTVHQRYVLYRNDPGINMELIFRNRTAGPQLLRLYNENQLTRTGRDLIKGYEGILLREPLDRRSVFGIHHYQSTRANALHINHASGHALGFTFRTPFWGYYNDNLWSPPRMTVDGKLKLDWSRALPKIFLGRLIDRPVNTKNMLYRRRQWNHGRPFEVGPRKEKRFEISFRFYSSEDDDRSFRRRFAADRYRMLGPVSVYGKEGTVLTAADTPLYFRDRFEHGDRWVSTEAADVQFTNGKARVETGASGHGMQTAFSRDFLDPTRMSGELTSISPETEARILLRIPPSGRSYQLQRLTEPGSFRMDLKKLPVRDLERCVLRVELHGREASSDPMRASFNHLALSWPEPKIPDIKGPGDGDTLSRLSVEISKMTEEVCERGFQLQVAKDQAFQSVVSEMTSPNFIRMTTQKIRRGKTLSPEKDLDPGTYFFRVRSIGIEHQTSPWTDVRSVTIEN